MFKFAIAALAGVGAVAASAAQDPMKVYYGNSWDVTEKDGARTILIEPDGTFQITLPGGKAFQGKWDRAGKLVCFRVASDAACFRDILGRKVGQAWTGREEGHSDDYKAIIKAGRAAHADHAGHDHAGHH